MAGKSILLVEGKDDEHVLRRLCANRGIPALEINEHQGVERLLESIPVRLKACEDGDVVGVVIDADTDLASRWRSLRDRLVELKYGDVPESPAPDGTIVDPPANTSLPRVGVWIMPDNQAKGILEDFLLFLVPEGSRLFEHVISSVAGIPEEERRFSQLAEPKAVIHTWLAWQEEPGKPLGTAITAKYLDPDVDQVGTLVAWMNRLFLQQ